MTLLLHLYLLVLITIWGLKSVQSETYIIHMELSAMPKIFSNHQSWYAATLSSISYNSNETSSTTTTTTTIPNLIYTYTSAIHGFSATLSSSQLELLQKSPGFVYSIRDVPVKIDTTHTSKFLGLNSKFGAWPESSYGKDVIIGVVDSGVWPESASYKDTGMTEVPSKWKGKCISDISFNSSVCNRKLIGTRYYNKGLIASRPDVNITVNSTRDTDGHGTHTSSTAAGNYVEDASFFGYAPGIANGIAPHARLAIYKVTWDDQGSASDLIAAIDQAINDGVDVLSISLHFRQYILYENPIAIASYAAMQEGIFVACSAGNDGPQYYSVRNGAPWVVTVGGSSMDRSFRGTIVLGNGVAVLGESLYVGKSSLSKIPLVYMNYCSDSDALGKVGYKIVICDRGEDYDLPDIIYDVKNANVAGAIFILTTSHMEEYIQTSFPATFVNLHDGLPILNYMNKSSEPKASIEFYKTQIGTKVAPIVGEYSSRGPFQGCPGVLKPDIIAPGISVLASWPANVEVIQSGSDKKFNPFNLLSGTSMACPHVAGVAALLKGKHPDWSPAAIRSAIMTTADLLDNTLSPIKDFADFSHLPPSDPPSDPLVMGSGHINPNKALNPGLIYDIQADDYVRFLCSMNYTKNQIKMITRSSSSDCSNPSSDLNYPSFIAFFNASESSLSTKVVQEFRRTVTNVGDSLSTYTANLTQIDEVKVTVAPKTLVFRHMYERLSFTLTLEGPTRLNNLVVSGSISWIDSKGKYVVRSPIIATGLNFDDLED